MIVDQENMSRPKSQEKANLNILIVEDDFASSEVLGEYLSNYGDCTIAVNGADAISAFKKALDKGRPYEMVCLDIMIPAINGHLVLEEIFQIEKNRGIDKQDGVKVIMTTAIDDSKVIMRAFNEGCDAYIVKPVTQEHLIEEMRKLNLIK